MSVNPVLATTTRMVVQLLAGDLNTVHTAHKADEWGITLNQWAQVICEFGETMDFIGP